MRMLRIVCFICLLNILVAGEGRVLGILRRVVCVGEGVEGVVLGGHSCWREWGSGWWSGCGGGLGVRAGVEGGVKADGEEGIWRVCVVAHAATGKGPALWRRT